MVINGGKMAPSRTAREMLISEYAIGYNLEFKMALSIREKKSFL